MVWVTDRLPAVIIDHPLCPGSRKRTSCDGRDIVQPGIGAGVRQQDQPIQLGPTPGRSCAFRWHDFADRWCDATPMQLAYWAVILHFLDLTRTSDFRRGRRWCPRTGAAILRVIARTMRTQRGRRGQSHWRRRNRPSPATRHGSRPERMGGVMGACRRRWNADSPDIAPASPAHTHRRSAHGRGLKARRPAPAPARLSRGGGGFGHAGHIS